MAIAQNHTHHAPIATEPDYSTKTTREILDALEDQLMANPGLSEALIVEVVARLGQAELQRTQG